MKSCAVVGVGVQVLLGAWLFGSSVSGCGGEATQEPKSADAALGETVVEAPTAAPPAEATASADPPPEPAAVDETPAPAPAKDPNAQREVKYVVTPEGLKVEVAGVRFFVSAEAKQVAQGWGAKIGVKAEATDGKTHVLLNPKNGPIAFAAAVFKKGSTEAERIPDSREGEGELTIGASSISFSRDFPNKGGRVLAIGETLDMEVALWGLGETKEDRRPVKQFVHVKMKVDKGKPKAIVEPPSTAK
ncbi:MAG: hypothetical protein K0R38_3185 [Polyangiaceae bacterium]|nr:hypothetical protein [Polyangiaceae bacterium]